MRIAVFGTGAVGGFFGGRLANAGEDVIFIARGDHLQAMQKNGLRVDSIGGDFVVHPVQATDNPTEVGKVDAVIVGVKAWQVSEAAEAMRPMVGPNTCVLPLQNGVEAPAELAAVLGEEHVLGGFCRIFSSIAGPGYIQHVGAEPFVGIGEMDNRLTERAERLRQAFVGAQINATVFSDIQVEIWKKFVFITAFSGICGMTRVSVGVWRSVSEVRQMYAQAVREALAVAKARGIAIPNEDEEVARVVGWLDNMPPNATASMQRDQMEGRPSELEYMNGAVVRLGKEVSVETPLHTFIYYSLLPGEMNARERMHF